MYTMPQVNSLNSLLCEHVRELLSEFGLSYKNCGEYISTQCFIHGGGSPRGLTITINEYSDFFGKYHCWSQNCHKKYGSSILGLLRALLQYRDGRLPSKYQTIKYALDFLKVDIKNIQVESKQSYKKKIIVFDQLS